MSFLDLYMNNNPLITSSDDDSEPVATIFGIPFDATHSYKPGCRFGPDAIRDSFNNIEIFHPELGIDLENVNIEDLGNTRHTVVASEMIDMVKKLPPNLLQNKDRCSFWAVSIPLLMARILVFQKKLGMLFLMLTMIYEMNLQTPN